MSSQYIGYYVLAVLAGIMGGIHVPINAALGSKIHSSIVATFTFYGIAFLLISVICLFTWERDAFAALDTVPRWYFVAGVISVFVIVTSTFLIPRIGAINLFVIVLSLQMISRTVISHFGWLESPVSSITWIKAAGSVLLIVGAILVVRD